MSWQGVRDKAKSAWTALSHFSVLVTIFQTALMPVVQASFAAVLLVTYALLTSDFGPYVLMAAFGLAGLVLIIRNQLRFGDQMTGMGRAIEGLREAVRQPTERIVEERRVEVQPPDYARLKALDDLARRDITNSFYRLGEVKASLSGLANVQPL